MEQKNLEQQPVERPLSFDMSWRSFGYLGAILLLGVVFGLLLYPLLPYPALAGFVLLGLAIVLIALTAPLFRNR